MPINGPVGRGFIVENRGAKPTKIGTSDDEEKNNGNEAREIEDCGLGGFGRDTCVSECG